MSWLSRALRRGARYTPGNQMREALGISNSNTGWQLLNPGGAAIGNIAEGNRAINARNILDPGDYLTTSGAARGGSPVQSAPDPGGQSLTPAPGGVQSMPTMSFGGGSGGRQYAPNPFQQGGGQLGPGGPPPTRIPTPSVPQNQQMIQALRGPQRYG